MCKCKDREQYEGATAIEYTRKYLTMLEADSTTWVIEYVCRDCGTRWTEDYPHSELHGGGPPRLRKST